MRRVREPQRMPVVHPAMHPILPEIEHQRDHQRLHQQGQAGEPGELFPVERMLDRFDHGAVADIAVDHADDGKADPDIEEIGGQFLPGQPPAFMARGEPFEAQQQQLEADADPDRGRSFGDRIGRVEPEGDQREQHRRLEPGEEYLLDRAALDLGNVFPTHDDRCLCSDDPLADANSAHTIPAMPSF
jgi:hypothetical protein